MNISTAIPRRTLLRIERTEPHGANLRRVLEDSYFGQGGLLTRQPRAASTCPQAPAGFSLIELLVVIAIIAIALYMAGSIIRPTGGRPAKAMELVAAMAAVARDDAIATGKRTRVAICVDTAAGEKYLRFVTALDDIDGDTETDDWKFSVRGQMLPQGTIYWPDYSKPEGAGNTMRLDLANPGAIQDGTTGSTFVFIEFDALGYPTTTSTGTQWVFTKALMDDAGGAPVVPEPMDRDGFILRQTGRPAYFRSPEDISKP